VLGLVVSIISQLTIVELLEQLYMYDINILTYKMSSSSSSKKRKLSEARCSSKHEERDNQIQEFWNKGVEPAEHSCVRIKAGRVYSYTDMVTSAERSSEPPAEDAAEGVWIENGWVLRNETGEESAIKFPVESIEISKDDWWTLRGMPVRA
jgi:hypothetical protein